MTDNCLISTALWLVLVNLKLTRLVNSCAAAWPRTVMRGPVMTGASAIFVRALGAIYLIAFYRLVCRHPA